jgi:hypothetical protein
MTHFSPSAQLRQEKRRGAANNWERLRKQCKSAPILQVIEYLFFDLAKDGALLYNQGSQASVGGVFASYKIASLRGELD